LRRLVKTDHGVLRRNPLVQIAAVAAADVGRFAGEFGMKPVARSRIAAGIGGQPKGKVDGLLA
jgi:phage terminase small subunit